MGVVKAWPHDLWREVRAGQTQNQKGYMATNTWQLHRLMSWLLIIPIIGPPSTHIIAELRPQPPGAPQLPYLSHPFLRQGKVHNLFVSFFLISILS